MSVVTVTAATDFAEVEFEEGMTLQEAISLSKIHVSNTADVRLNGTATEDFEVVLEEDDRITVLDKIAGA